jgi:membrane protein YqaA with SNARE-associated domain
MQTLTTNLSLSALALVAGTMIGYAFGAVQVAAARRNERLQQEGKFKSAWAATPGSFRRIAYLLVALAGVQFLFPVFFTTGGASQWCVSVGVVLGYGVTLYRQMRLRTA